MQKVSVIAAGLMLLTGASLSSPRDFEIGMQALREGNFAEAYCRWKPLAKKGNAEAQYNLGWLYANGNGLNVDVKQAVHWWRDAALQGHADAQFAIALAYTTGEGLKKDLKEAVKWYVIAAEQGHRDAREILTRLNGDPKIDLLALNPKLFEYEWFGWYSKVQGDRINVRGGPGTKHAIVAKLTKGTEIRVVGRRNDWFLVVLPEEIDKESGWIYTSLLKRTSQPSF